jgi:hypothetical protein
VETSPLVLWQRESVSGKLQNAADCCEPLLLSDSQVATG